MDPFCGEFYMKFSHFQSRTFIWIFRLPFCLNLKMLRWWTLYQAQTTPNSTQLHTFNCFIIEVLPECDMQRSARVKAEPCANIFKSIDDPHFTCKLWRPIIATDSIERGMSAVGRLSIKLSSYQYMDSHYKDKTKYIPTYNPIPKRLKRQSNRIYIIYYKHISHSRNLFHHKLLKRYK